MSRKNISSGLHDLEKQIGFSRAVRVGNWIAISGTAPRNPDGTNAAAGDVYGQTVRCLEIIQRATEAAGGSLADVVRTRVMLTRASDWQLAAKAHGEYFGQIRPACTFVEVSAFIDADWLVEIEADCLLDNIPQS